MGSPRVKDARRLVRLGKYLIDKLRYVTHYDSQDLKNGMGALTYGLTQTTPAAMRRESQPLEELVC